MKIVSIIAFLLVVVFFTMWSLYEDTRQRISYERFDTQLFKWAVREGDSASFVFKPDTMIAYSKGTTSMIFDTEMKGNYAISFRANWAPTIQGECRVFGAMPFVMPEDSLVVADLSFNNAQWIDVQMSAINGTFSTIVANDTFAIQKSGNGFWGMDFADGTLMLTAVEIRRLRE